MWSRAIGLATLGTALLFVPPMVSAQDTATEVDGAAYQRAIETAVAELGSGRHAEALALFREAHRIAPSARTLRGIAMASFEVADYVEAVRHARRALDSQVRPLEGRLRVQTEALLERASAYVARYRIELTPEDAVLRLDGVQVALEANGVLLVGLGRHAVRAEAAGHEPVEEVVVVRGGERAPLTLRANPRESTPAPGREPTRRARPAPDHTAAHVAWTVATASGAASVPGWIWFTDRADTVSLCRSICDNRALLESQRDAALGLSLSALGLGVAAGVVGLILWLVEPSTRPAEQACRASGGVFVCRGAWL